VAALGSAVRRSQTGDTGAGDKDLLGLGHDGQVVLRLAAGVGIGDAVDAVAHGGLAGAALVAADAVDDLLGLAGLGLVRQFGIGERGARHDDEVGLLVAQHSLGHIDIVVAADCQHRDLDRALDGGGVLRIVHDRDEARRDDRLLGGEHALRAVQRVHTGLLEHLGHDDRLRQLNAALDVVAGVEAEQDRVVRADGGADGVDDLEREAHTVFQRAAVLVRALVGERGHELVDQVAVRTVDLHAVKAALLRSRGGFAERGDEPVDLLHGQSTRDVGDGGLFERRRGDGVRVVSLEGALTAGVVELRAHQTAGGVHLADGLGPCGHLIVVPERADDRVAAGVGRDAEILREDETPAALDLGDKVGVDRLVRRAVGVAHMRRHGADDKAVFQLKVADLAGLKYFFQFHSIPPVLHAHAGSGRCAAAWAIAIVGLFLPKNLCDFNNALFCNDEPKSKYIQKSS
jgi:hypothetical protein